MEAAWRQMNLPERLIAMALVTAAAYALARLAARVLRQGDPEPAPAGDALPALYSEHQILVCTALLSPLAGWALLISNLRALGERRTAWLAAFAGVLLTAALFAVGMLAGENRQQLARPLVEGLSVGGTWVAVLLWMREALLAHRAAGGALRSSWRAFGHALLADLAGVAVLFGGIFVFFVFAPASVKDGIRECVTFSPGEEICYREGANEADARNVGAALQRLHVFNGHRSIRTRVRRPAGKLVLAVQVDSQGAADLGNLRARLGPLAEDLPNYLPRKEPMELELCDAEWHPLATLPE